MARRALLVGINRYAAPGSDLRGCVNDVADVASLLTELFGFTDADITTLIDDQATQEAMKEAITALVLSGEPGDVLLLHYSGHGSHVSDLSGDEPDRRDEVLCPHDLSWSDPFLDDWLRETFDRLVDGVNLTVVMDCCHSGSNTRRVYPPDADVPRYLPNPNLVLDGRDQDRVTGNGEVAGGGPAPGRRGRGRSGDVHVVDLAEALITGCRDTQTSADAYIDNDYYGALTYHLVRAVRELGPQASYRQVHARTLALLRGHYDQVPQLEGRAERLDRPFLAPLDEPGQDAPEPAGPVSVTTR